MNTKRRESVRQNLSVREQQAKRLIHEYEEKEKEREKEKDYVDKKRQEYYNK